ncbi:syntaxin 8 [Arctopsyche grandis]|uniref:syntaxin 8 n=1 Tax=Arctopsyche grandis TaxID=121162 RepID=UPI00406D7257
MALIQFDDDPWITKHDACERLYRDTQAQLITWSYETRSSILYGQLSADIRLKLKEFQTKINELLELNTKITKEQLITDAESERRSRQIEVLQSKNMQLRNQFNNGVQSSYLQHDNYHPDEARQQLLGNTSGPSRNKPAGDVKSVNWGTGSDDEELLDPNKANISDLKQQRSRMIDDQDRGLEELSKIISRQKNIAENIGNEVSLHNDIIDDLGEQIERTDGRVQAETIQIRGIGNKDNTCGYWIFIILLFIAIVVLIFL